MRILAISAGLSEGSATTRLAEGVAEEASGHVGGRVQVLELRPLARDIAEAMVTGFPSSNLEAAFEAVAGADAVVAATPVYNALPSGLFVEFFDVLPEGTLRGKPVAIAATGGSPRHSLVTEQAVRPMFVYLHASVPTTAVYAATEDWGAPGVGYDGEAGHSLVARMRREGAELAALVRTDGRGEAGGCEATDVSPREATEEPTVRREGASGGETAGLPLPAGVAAVAVASRGGDAVAEFPDFVSFDRLLGR